MKEFVEARETVLVTKLQNLIEQFDALLLDDFPFPDSRDAIGALKSKAQKLRARLKDFGRYPENIKIAMALQVKYELTADSHIIGILARSATTRNAFELYHPFKGICQSFFDDDIHLVLSSEWNYVPFTYPMNLQDLPDFIIIGLPATESSNVLVFPAAAHELGHSIWLKKDLGPFFTEGVTRSITEYLEHNPKLIESITLGLNTGSDASDLFARQIRNQFVQDAYQACIRQMEELFCDFVALCLFGESYLFAFAYIVAPSDGGRRSLSYPDTQVRAHLLEMFGKRIGMNVAGYASEFKADAAPPAPSYDALVLRLADNVRSTFDERVFEKVQNLVSGSGNLLPNSDRINAIATQFKYGIPYDEECSLGEMVSAAWKIYIEGAFSHQKRQASQYISDLVLKSAEARHFREIIRDA